MSNDSKDRDFSLDDIDDIIESAKKMSSDYSAQDEEKTGKWYINEADRLLGKENLAGFDLSEYEEPSEELVYTKRELRPSESESGLFSFGEDGEESTATYGADLAPEKSGLFDFPPEPKLFDAGEHSATDSKFADGLGFESESGSTINDILSSVSGVPDKSLSDSDLSAVLSEQDFNIESIFSKNASVSESIKQENKLTDDALSGDMLFDAQEPEQNKFPWTAHPTPTPEPLNNNFFVREISSHSDSEAEEVANEAVADEIASNEEGTNVSPESIATEKEAPIAEASSSEGIAASVIFEPPVLPSEIPPEPKMFSPSAEQEQSKPSGNQERSTQAPPSLNLSAQEFIPPAPAYDIAAAAALAVRKKLDAEQQEALIPPLPVGFGGEDTDSISILPPAPTGLKFSDEETGDVLIQKKSPKSKESIDAFLGELYSTGEGNEPQTVPASKTITSAVASTSADAFEESENNDDHNDGGNYDGGVKITAATESADSVTRSPGRTDAQVGNFLLELDSVGEDAHSNTYSDSVSGTANDVFAAANNQRTKRFNAPVTNNVDGKTKKISGVAAAAKAVAGAAATSAVKAPAAVDGQLVLDGFGNDDDTVENVDESDVERELNRKRREAAKNFRLMQIAQAVGEPEPENNPMEYSDFEGDISEIDEIDESVREKKITEYTNPTEKIKIGQFFQSLKGRAGLRTAALTVLEIASLIFTAVPNLSISSDKSAFAILPFFIFVLATTVSYQTIFAGFRSLISLKPDASSSVFLCNLGILLQFFVLGITGKSAELSNFSAVAVTVMLLYSIAELLSASRTLDNFKFCAFDDEDLTYSIKEFESAKEAFEIGKAVSPDTQRILYSGRVLFPTNFAAHSMAQDVTDRESRLTVPATAVLSVVLGIIFGFANKSFASGVTIFAGTLCAAVPVALKLAAAAALFVANKKLNNNGSMIVNLDTAERALNTDAVVVDSGELFSRSECEMYGMKDFKTVRIDDALLYAAAMVIKSGGPMTEAFEGIIVGRHDLLPPVKSLVYEDRQGLTAYIHGQKVFLGNRELLHNHNIEPPSKTAEMKHSGENRGVIYLAIEKKVAVMFVMSYAPKEELLDCMSTLESNGIVTLVNTSDANITDEMLAYSFCVEPDAVKVINASAGNVFNHRRNAEKEREPVGLIHDGRIESFLKCVCAAVSLGSFSKLAAGIQLAFLLLNIAVLIIIFALLEASIVTVIVAAVLQATLTVALTVFGSVKKLW